MEPLPVAGAQRRRYRILTIDGGGIYGLIDAIWLRKICERVEGFLDPRSEEHRIDFMAGISSGAINVLLLAAADNPREYVMRGHLERFWTEEANIFTNNNPVARYLSCFGLAAWGGEVEFREVLRRHLGDRRLCDLRPYVSASVFNWAGDDMIDFSGHKPAIVWPRHPAHPGSADETPDLELDASLRAVLESSDMLDGKISELQRPGMNPHAWRPRMMTNFDHDPDRDTPAYEVAYAAAAPPGLRPVRGAGDAATYTGNPSVEAIAAWVYWMRVRAYLAAGPAKGAGHRDIPLPPWLLDDISLLSLGNGIRSPNYWLRRFDFGLLPMSMLPTNPLIGALSPPAVSVPLQAPSTEADFISNMLLGDRYFRLDPGIVNTPTALATMSARSTLVRQMWFQRIYHATGTPLSQNAIDMVSRFLGLGWHAIPENAAHPSVTSVPRPA